MALEQRLTLAPVVLLHHHQSSSSAATAEEEKAPRLPRWTRQELLVLIQGKRVAENRVRRGRMGEPKWSSVSSYCKRHGVNRGPVQCRKRWSNLAGDFKKIKEWETQIKKEGEEAAAESFWIMRNDLRRERKLPGFFDREVYDILDGGGDDDKKSSSSSLVLLSLAPEATEKEDKEVVFDSPEKEAAAPTPTPPVSAAAATGGGGGGYESFSQGVPPPPAGGRGDKETSPSRSPSPGPEVRKRKRDDDAGAAAAEGEMSVQKQLIEAMERNGRLLTSQLEIQNTNSQLDREQRKNDANSLFSVLNKLADAMVRIADKL